MHISRNRIIFLIVVWQHLHNLFGLANAVSNHQPTDAPPRHDTMDIWLCLLSIPYNSLPSYGFLIDFCELLRCIYHTLRTLPLPRIPLQVK